MITPWSSKLSLRLTPAIVLLALTLPGAAQSIRPSAAAGSNTSRSSTSRNTNTNRNTSRTNGSTSSGGLRQYRSNTLMGDATIQVDPETRSLVIVTDEATHAEAAKVIENLDHPKPQVLIKVVFVEVTFDKNLDVGLEGSYTFKLGNGIPLSGTNTTTTTTKDGTITTTNTPFTLPTKGTAVAETLFGLAQQSNGSFLRLATDDWQATLHALASHGNLKILSRPSIMARNNQEAVIVVGQEVPFVTNSQITNNGQTINTIQYQDVGIILRVTPFITSDKTVEMIVAPEISSLSNQTVSISDTIKAPIINKRSAETVVVTPNATTVVIGGMMQKQDTSSIQKIPILGDIPILGLPFRHTVKGEQKSELLIFLTPYIIEGTEKMKELTLKEANNAEMTREAFSADEIRKNLDTLELMPECDPKDAPVPAAKCVAPAKQ